VEAEESLKTAVVLDEAVWVLAAAKDRQAMRYFMLSLSNHL
jgi:hypothetical protein